MCVRQVESRAGRKHRSSPAVLSVNEGGGGGSLRRAEQPGRSYFGGVVMSLYVYLHTGGESH